MKPLHDLNVRWGIRVPMRDGATLSVDLYRPGADGPAPAIVVRTPYGKGSESAIEQASYFARKGYAVLCADVRGRGDSDGEFVPYRRDALDGYDLIEWAAEQPWCTGKIGSMGGSYLGRIQWLTALAKPPHLASMIVRVTPSDPFVEWPTGIPIPPHLSWLRLTSGRALQNIEAIDWRAVYEHLPLVTMDERAGLDLPQWREEFAHPRLDDYWRAISYQTRFNEIDLPVLHISGWYDDEQVGTLRNYIGMTRLAPTERARRSQKLIMGPWAHNVNAVRKLGEIDFGPEALIDLQDLEERWFGYFLRGEDNGIVHEPPVSIFVMGKNSWRQEREWPLSRAQQTRFYLHSGGGANSLFGDGRLGNDEPSGESPDHYTYDPLRPVPFIMEPTSAQIGGPDDYAAIERRDDVLVYSTEPLKEPMEITGPVLVELFASSSAADTDFMAKLLDVWPNGFAQRLTDGMVRARFRNGMDAPELIVPGEVYRFSIDCWYTSHVFLPGHRIRLEIASSAFPKYDRNPNTGGPLGMETRTQIADQTVYHDSERPSALVLAVVPAAE